MCCATTGSRTIEYTEQLTYLLFLKMAHERATRPLKPEQIVPESCSWQRLLDAEGDALEVDLPAHPGGAGPGAGHAGDRSSARRRTGSRTRRSCKRLIVDLIDKENWSAAGVDIKGDAYEELLAKGAEDIKSGAGQYFTPRALISAMVDCVQPDRDGHGRATRRAAPAASCWSRTPTPPRDAEDLTPDAAGPPA